MTDAKIEAGRWVGFVPGSTSQQLQVTLDAVVLDLFDYCREHEIDPLTNYVGLRVGPYEAEDGTRKIGWYLNNFYPVGTRTCV